MRTIPWAGPVSEWPDGPDHPPFRYIGRKATRNINWSIMDQLIFFATCRTCSSVYRCGCVWSHAMPNPNDPMRNINCVIMPQLIFSRNARNDRTPQQRTKERKRSKTRTRRKIKEQEEKKTTLTQETQQEQEHSNTTPKPKPKHKKKHDGRLAPGCAETAVNGGFPTKLSILRRFSHRYRPAKRRPAWPSYRNSGMRAT